MSLLLSASFTLLLSSSFGFPTSLHESPIADESRQDELRLDHGFIPSQVDSTQNDNARDSSPNLEAAEQNFFPSFFRSGQQLPSSRPFSTRHISGSTSNRFISNYQSSFDESVLGSGDFTILKGGTFYHGNQDYVQSGSSFHDSSKPFSRPFALALESHQTNDPFADFKDFADIAGLDTDFSQLVETKVTKHEPKNIFEELQLIDEEKSRERAHLVDAKKGKHKAKLMLSKISKETKKKQLKI